MELSSRKTACLLRLIFIIRTAFQLLIFSCFLRGFKVGLRNSEFRKPAGWGQSLSFLNSKIFYWRVLSKRFGPYKSTFLSIVLFDLTDKKPKFKSGISLWRQLLFWQFCQSYRASGCILLFLPSIKFPDILGNTEVLHVFLELCLSQILWLKIMNILIKLPSLVLICLNTKNCALLSSRFCL